MTDPSLLLQGAINIALRGDSALNALIGSRVYDHVPDSATYPFVSFGPGQVVDQSTDCGPLYEVFQQIDIWSRGQGFPECKAIGAALVAALEGLSLSGGNLVSFEHQTTRYMRDQDHTISHGVVSVRAIITE